jgi:hypothetical protein
MAGEEFVEESLNVSVSEKVFQEFVEAVPCGVWLIGS